MAKDDGFQIVAAKKAGLPCLPISKDSDLYRFRIPGQIRIRKNPGRRHLDPRLHDPVGTVRQHDRRQVFSDALCECRLAKYEDRDIGTQRHGQPEQLRTPQPRLP
jgi:hypothetical protein